MMNPRVSGVMAVHNGAEHIAESIEAIISQTMVEWELLIVDDASTDGTVDVVARYLEDSRISYRRLEKNVGSGAARNIAIGCAKAPFIAPVDADDISMPMRFERQAEVLETNPDLVAVSSQMLWFGPGWPGATQRTVFPTSSEEIAAGFARGRMAVSHPASMYRRSEALAVGGYDEACRRSQDLALFIKLSNKRMAGLDDVLVLYRSSRRVSPRYIYRNDRYGRLARVRNRPGGPVPGAPSSPATGLKDLAIGVVALLKWIRASLGLNPRVRRTSRYVKWSR